MRAYYKATKTRGQAADSQLINAAVIMYGRQAVNKALELIKTGKAPDIHTEEVFLFLQ